MNVTVLVDFENDSVRTALEVAEALGDELWGVRLDTSETLVDRALWDEMGELQAHRREPAPGARRSARRWTQRRLPAGQDRRLRRLHRRAGSREFEARGVPVDAYGVGSSLIRGENDFTADVVMVDGPARARPDAGRAATASNASS